MQCDHDCLVRCGDYDRLVEVRWSNDELETAQRWIFDVPTYHDLTLLLIHHRQQEEPSEPQGEGAEENDAVFVSLWWWWLWNVHHHHHNDTIPM